jgi:O-antigen/teichoic acid export membrane protein
VDAKGIGKNYIYNLGLNFLNTLYPLIVLPYVTRILGPDNLGKVNFAQNFVSYFLLVSTFGLQVYGVREIARVRHDKAELDKTYAELFSVSMLLSLVAALAYIGIVLCFSRFRADKELFLLFTLPILLNGISVDWFFSGMERFGYITVRNAIFKLGSLPFLFIFVHSSSDYIVFAWISIAAINGSALVNILGTRRFVRPSFRGIDIKKHLRALSTFFIITLVSTFAVSLPVTFLGFMGTDRDVALFTLDYKIILVTLSVINALSVVLLPRLSMMAERESTRFDEVTRSLSLMINAFAIPAACGVAILSGRIVNLLGGAEFADSAKALRIMSVVILVSANSSFLVGQILYPRKKEAAVLASLIATAIAAIAADLFLIKTFVFPGAVAGYLLAETLYLAILVVVAFRQKVFSYDGRSLARFCGYSLIMSVAVWLTDRALPASSIYLIVPVSIGITVYAACFALFKDPLFVLAIRKLSKSRGAAENR